MFFTIPTRNVGEFQLFHILTSTFSLYPFSFSFFGAYLFIYRYSCGYVEVMVWIYISLITNEAE